MPAATATQQSNPFIKQLASSDRKTRDGALSSLQTYLQRSTSFSELDFLKLWKGLFFCMWMSDKSLTQQRLARDLADLLNAVKGRENFLGFLDAFWKTMAREWSGIEALRMDKFLYLVRCYINTGFEVLSRRDWANEELLDEYLAILAAVPLNVRDPKIPNGLRYHVIDVYVDELDKVDTKRNAPLEKILAPLRKLGKESLTKSVRERVAEALDDERFIVWKSVRSEDQDDGGDAVQDNEKQPQNGAEGIESDMDDDDGEFGGFDD